MMLVPGSVGLSAGGVGARGHLAEGADSGSEGETGAAEQAFALLLTSALATAVPIGDGQPGDLAGAAAGKALPVRGNGLPPGLPGLIEPAIEPPGRAAGNLADSVLVMLTSAHGGQARPGAGGDPLAALNGLSDPLALAQTPASANRATTQAGLMAGQPPLAPSQPEFDQKLGQRLMMMVQHGVRQASVSVHPEHLGPIEIRLKLDGDSTQLTLHSPHAAVRDALDQALPRLREMFGDAGMTLADVDIGNGDAETGFGDRSDTDSSSASPEGEEGADDDGAARQSAVRVGLLDTFA